MVQSGSRICFSIDVKTWRRAGTCERHEAQNTARCLIKLQDKGLTQWCSSAASENMRGQQTVSERSVGSVGMWTGRKRTNKTQQEFSLVMKVKIFLIKLLSGKKVLFCFFVRGGGVEFLFWWWKLEDSENIWYAHCKTSLTKNQKQLWRLRHEIV